MTKVRYRKLRRLSFTATVLSGALFLTTCIFHFGFSGKGIEVYSLRGCIAFAPRTTRPGQGPYLWTVPDMWFGTLDSYAKMIWQPSMVTRASVLWAVVIPLWIPTTVSLVASWVFRRNARVPSPGHCKKCDYDLNGNESAVCPECGTPT